MWNNGSTTLRLIPGTGQNKTATASSQSFTAVGLQTRAIRVVAETANVRIEISQPALAATATSALISTLAGPEYFSCSPGDIVTVIQDSAGGVCNIMELTH